MTRRIKLAPPDPSINISMIVIAVLAIIVALVLALGFRAIQIPGGAGGALIKVPNDYLTIQEAINAAKPGDIIQVTAGIYQENITLNKPVSLIAETIDEIDPTRNPTILDGANAGPTILIPSGLSQMPIIRGFVIQNGVEDIQASSEFIAEFNYIHSANHLVYYQAGAGGFNRSNVYFNARENAIRVDHIDRPLIIENNRIMYSGESGIEISLQSATAPPAMIEVSIWNNMILGNGEDGIQFVDHAGDPQDTNRRFVIAGNLIANHKMAGIGLMPNANTTEDFSGAATVEAIRVINNTFYGNSYGISGGDNLVAINNIIANSLGRGTWRVPAEEDGISVIAYTLFDNNNGSNADDTNLGPGVILDRDPRFVAAPNAGPDGTWGTLDDDFSGLVLRSDSPAIDKGVTQFQAPNGELVPPTPLTGFTGAAPDLGWREFGAPLFMTPTSTPVSTATASSTATLATFTAIPSATGTVVSPTPETMTATPLSATPTATTISASATATSAPATATVTSTATPGVSVQSIAPNSAPANATLTVTITGSGFKDGALVTFEGGAGTPPQIQNVQVVNATTITVTLTALNAGTSPDVWDVRVTNTDTSSAVLPDAFTVTPAS